MPSQFVQENNKNDFLSLAAQKGWSGKNDQEFLSEVYSKALNGITADLDPILNCAKDFDFSDDQIRQGFIENTAYFFIEHPEYNDLYELFKKTEMLTKSKTKEVLAGENNNLPGQGNNIINPGNAKKYDVPEIVFERTEGMEALSANLEIVANNLNNSPDSKGEKKKLAERVSLYKNALDTLIKANKEEEKDSEKIKKAYDRMKEFPGFLIGDPAGLSNTTTINYSILKEADLNCNALIFSAMEIDNVITRYNANVVNATNYEVETKNADRWIDDYKAEFVNTANNYYPNMEREQFIVAKIMAARILVNSKRNEKSSLEKPVSNRDIENKARELLENKTFKDWVRSIPQATLIDNINRKYTHGGLLDDMFKKHLLNKPAGELHNDAVLERFMPTVIDRIEVLQTQADNLPKNNFPTKEIAEVMLLRAMIDAPRDNKASLKVKIPTNTRLDVDVKAVLKDDHFAHAINTPRIRGEFQRGHGGEMILNMETEADKSNNLVKFAVECVKNKMSVKYRMLDLQDQAKALRYTLSEEMEKDPYSEKVNRLCERGRVIIAEQLALTGIQMNSKLEGEINNLTNKAPSMHIVDEMTKGILKGNCIKTLLPVNDPKKHLDEIIKFSSNPLVDQYGKEVVNNYKANKNNLNKNNNIINNDNLINNNNIINDEPKIVNNNNKTHEVVIGMFK